MHGPRKNEEVQSGVVQYYIYYIFGYMILDIAKQHVFLNRLGPFMGWDPLEPSYGQKTL